MPVSEQMEVLGKAGEAIPNVYCIGDANGARSASSRDPFESRKRHIVVLAFLNVMVYTG